MLVIRKEQMDVFARIGLGKLEGKIVDLLMAEHKAWAEAMGPEALREFVKHGIARAGKYGLRTQAQVARYVLAMRTLGKNFDISEQHPWAQRLLEREDLPAGEKVERLLDAVQYHVEAARIEKTGRR